MRGRSHTARFSLAATGPVKEVNRSRPQLAKSSGGLPSHRKPISHLLKSGLYSRQWGLVTHALPAGP